MLKNTNNISKANSKYLKSIFLFLLSFFLIFFIYLGKQARNKYIFFIEFNDANGVIVGTPVRMRGISIGAVNRIQLKFNGILVLATINSEHIIIPKNSIIETTQSGLLNESIIDIVPIKFSPIDKERGPLSLLCDSSKIICNKTYLLGDRGLNYDDLVRSTTRISQRFDDPSFFNLFYVFLEHSIELTESLSLFAKTFMNTWGENN